jgi:uncharacterized FAD-dependent dehydrogenase
MEAAVESRFDVTDAEKTVRIVAVAESINKMDAEASRLRSENISLLRLNAQLREMAALLRSELVRLKASHIGTDKRCSIAETMAHELMVQLESLSLPGRR